MSGALALDFRSRWLGDAQHPPSFLSMSFLGSVLLLKLLSVEMFKSAERFELAADFERRNATRPTSSRRRIRAAVAPRRHHLILLRDPTRPTRETRSPSTSASPSSAPPSSRATSRPSSCCPSTSTPTSGWEPIVSASALISGTWTCARGCLAAHGTLTLVPPVQRVARSPPPVFDFFNNLNHFYGIINEYDTVEACPTMSAGHG